MPALARQRKDNHAHRSIGRADAVIPVIRRVIPVIDDEATALYRQICADAVATVATCSVRDVAWRHGAASGIALSTLEWLDKWQANGPCPYGRFAAGAYCQSRREQHASDDLSIAP
jgi:hypothetical protein